MGVEVREAADRCGDCPAPVEQAAAARPRQSPPATAVSRLAMVRARLPCDPAATAPFLLMQWAWLSGPARAAGPWAGAGIGPLTAGGWETGRVVSHRAGRHRA